jgi:hypothetical protein
MPASPTARRLSALAATVLAGTACAVAAPTSASAAPIEPNRVYKLFAGHTVNAGLKVVDVAGGSTADLARIVIQPTSSALSQRWFVEHHTSTPFGTPVYRLINQRSGKCLDVEGARTDAGSRLVQFTCHSGQHQQFFITDLSPATNVKRLTARHSGLTVDVAGASTAAGTPVIQWPNLGLRNQKFSMPKVG